jgi:predicted HTH transcriptional regulator
MRAIVSLLNSEGGILFIGVSDTGEIIGLENDYRTFKKQNQDGFLLHLDNLINNYLGKEFHQYLTISVENIEKNEICVVQVRKAEDPVFLKSKDTSGNIIEEFFIRGAASSQPLGLKDTMDYIKSHWKK